MGYCCSVWASQRGLWGAYGSSECSAGKEMLNSQFGSHRKESLSEVTISDVFHAAVEREATL